MLKSFLIFGCLLGLNSTTSYSQKVVVNVVMDSSKSLPGSDTIYYDLNRKLTWEDFNGRPDPNSPAGAATASGFAYNWEGENDGKTLAVNVTVYTFFFINKSWKKAGAQTPYHLQHEQIHFDITRLGAKNLVKELKNGQYTAANYSQIIKNIYAKAYNENVALQQQYDMQTRNSRDTTQQAEWNMKIGNKIMDLK